jgi:hypothetical protein
VVPAPVVPAPLVPGPVAPAPAPAQGFDALEWGPPDLPPAAMAAARELYDDGTPPALREGAALMRSKGFPKAGKNLDQRAKDVELELEMSGRIVAIKPGWNPSFVSKHYTGDPNPSELMKLNGISVVSGFPSPWQIGQKILLPEGWDLSKGEPPALKGAASKSAQKAFELAREKGHVANVEPGFFGKAIDQIKKALS